MKTTMGMAAMMSLAVALALIAFVSPISAVVVGDHDITFVSYTYDITSDISTYTYEVTSGTSPSLSHWSIAWCNEAAIIDVSEDPWEYGTDLHTGITGIKFDKGYDDEDDNIRIVWFTLSGEHPPHDCVAVGTKAGSGNQVAAIAHGCVEGPVVDCGDPIPEFATIAIPIIALLGLVAFYRRKQKK